MGSQSKKLESGRQDQADSCKNPYFVSDEGQCTRPKYVEDNGPYCADDKGCYLDGPLNIPWLEHQ